MQYENVGYSSKKMVMFIAFVCFITNISQMPAFVESSLTQFVAIPAWVLVLTVLMLKRYIFYTRLSTFALLVCYVTLLYTLMLNTFTDKSYFSIAIIYPFYLSIFVFFMGVFLSKVIKYQDLPILINSYIISAIIIAVDIFRQYIIGADIYERIYIYASKNSVSQILLTALIFLILVYKPKSGSVGAVTKYIGVLFLILVLFFLKSRASIIGIPIMVFIILVLGKKQSKLKRMVVVSIFVFCILLMNDQFYDIIINQILGAGRDWSNLDDVSSGRYSEWINFLQLINGSELFGIGQYKVESFPLSVILQYGIPMGCLLIITALWPLWWGFKNLNRTQHINISYIIIAVLYFFNGLFEQLAPFGPGVKCYMLWFMFGILYGLRDQSDINSNPLMEGDMDSDQVIFRGNKRDSAKHA